MFQPQQTFKAGFPSDYAVGEVSVRFQQDQRVWIIREEEGIYAIFAKCTHLGCTPRWLNAGIYIVMGWLCIAAIGEMLRVLPPWALTWLMIGGVTYTLGAVVYITKTMNFWPGKFGFHEVWHIFVILAALAHFIAIAIFVAPIRGI